MLFFNDVSSFTGSSAWGNTQRSTYGSLHNDCNQKRASKRALQKGGVAEAEKILRQVAENAPEFQKSLADYAAGKDSTIDLVKGKIAEADTRIGELEGERQRIDRRLSFLLEDDDLEMARSFREEYKERVSALKGEERELISRKKQLHFLQKQLYVAKNSSKSNWLEHVNQAINCVGNKDLAALQSAYRRLFHKIIVHPLDNARLQLEFVFKEMSTSFNKGLDIICPSVDLVEPNGVAFAASSPLASSTP